MKQAENSRVRELVKKIESHSHRQDLQADLQQIGFWLQRLSWVNIVRHVLQVCDLMDSSVSLFSVDILQYEATVSVGSVSRCGFLCYSQAGPAKCLVCVLVAFSLPTLSQL